MKVKQFVLRVDVNIYSKSSKLRTKVFYLVRNILLRI